MFNNKVYSKRELLKLGGELGQMQIELNANARTNKLLREYSMVVLLWLCDTINLEQKSGVCPVSDVHLYIVFVVAKTLVYNYTDVRPLKLQQESKHLLNGETKEFEHI